MLPSVLLLAQVKAASITPTAPPLSVDPKIVALEKKSGLRFDDLFPRLPFWGRTAGGHAWSPSDRYLTYVWNPYEERAYGDLWMFDKTTGKSVRLTSPELMAKFDKTVPKAIEQKKKDDAELAEALKKNDLDWREWRMKKREEDKDRKEPLPRYEGVSAAKWSDTGDEFAFSFRGDLYRWKVGDAMPKRLTRTQDGESVVEWAKDGNGLVYQRGSAFYRTRFGQSFEEQLTPKLPDGVNFGGASLSPDGEKLLVTGWKSKPSARKIAWVSYRNRFPEAKSWDRNVSDDLFPDESYVFLYDLKTADPADPREDKPWEVWKWAGGKSWQEIAMNARPWSADSKRIVFGTWNRDDKAFTLATADIEKREVKTFYKSSPKGEHTTPGMADPMFTPDGKVIALLDNSGYRHAWRLDPAVEGGAPEQLTTGNWEAYPLRVAKDGSRLWLTGGKDNPAIQQLYSVNLATKELRSESAGGFNVDAVEISESGEVVATVMKSFTNPPETYVGTGYPVAVTDSHSRAARPTIERPSYFTWQNRLKQTLHGYAFLPDGLKKGERRPLFIYVYGGPLGKGKTVEEGSFNTTSYWFGAYLAKTFGYIAVAVDVRGQSGYGNDIAAANFARPGAAQTEDMIDLVNSLATKYPIDRNKVGLNGWSFGGFQTQHAMYNAPDVFKLGIAGAGPTEWQNYNNWYTQGVIGEVPNRKPEDLDKYSLTKVAKNLSGPLLLLHGIEDDNVLFNDTVHVYQKLLQYGRGPLVELALDPTGGHGMGGDMDSRDRHAIYLAFLNKWWGPYQKK